MYLRMIVIMVISIYMARVVLKVLGIEDFGVYSVVAGAVAFMGFLNNAMTMATQRFLNVELGSKTNNISKIFSMALNIHVIIAIIVVLLAEGFGLWLVNNTLNIPSDRLSSANFAFQCVVGITFFSIVQVPYNSAIFAYEKMDIYAYLSIFDVCLKLLLTYMLLWVNCDKLILYSILLLGVQILLFILYTSYVSFKIRECRFKLLWDIGLFKQLSGFLGWNVCGQVAQVLTTQGVNMIANVFHGVIINAAIEVTNHVNGAISMFVNNFQTSFRPQIMKSYAAEQFNDMKSLVYRSSKVSFYLLYVISLPIMLNIDYILSAWLGEVPEYSAIFCKLLIWYSYLEALGMPLVMAIMATGKNKYYQIFVSIVISLNIVFTWLLLYFGFSPEWIFYVKIMLSFLVISVRLFFAKLQAGVEPKSFFRYSLMPTIYIILITQPIYYFMCEYVEILSLPMKMTVTFLFILFVCATILYVGFTANERVFVIRLFIDKLNKKS